MSLPKFRAIARIQPLDETDEDPADTFLTGARREGDSILIAELAPPDGEWLAGTQQVFEFDHVFGVDSTYRDIHSQELRFIVESALRGHDSSLFVAGSAKCGKRHMVMGQPFLTAAEGGISGLAERIVGDIYIRDSREEWVISISIYSIYKESIIDLLAPIGPQGAGLAIVDDLDGNKVVSRLSDISINNTADLLLLLRGSIQARETLEEDAEGRDAESTLVLVISMQCVVGPEAAKVHLIDLAGSSDSDSAAIGSGAALQSTHMLGQGLAMLGKIFASLALPGGKESVDYSASTLTKLMKHYLQGASSVAVLSVCSPKATVSLSAVKDSLALAGKARAVFAQARPERGPTESVLAAHAQEREKAAKAGAALAHQLTAAVADAPGDAVAHSESRAFGAKAAQFDKVRHDTPPQSAAASAVATAAAFAAAAAVAQLMGDESLADEEVELVTCGLCARKFAPDRLARHEAACKGPVAKAPAKSPRVSAVEPRASALEDAPSPSPASARVQPEANGGDDGGLVACEKCGRKFNADRIATHSAVCKGEGISLGGNKSARASAAVDLRASNVEDAEPPAPAASRASRAAAKGDGLEPCPKCGRRFAADRIEKHASVCKGEGISIGKSPRAGSAVAASPAGSPIATPGPSNSSGFGALGADYRSPGEPDVPKSARAKTPARRPSTLGIGDDGGGGGGAPGKSPRKSPRGGSTARGGDEGEAQYRGKPGELQTILEDVFTGEGVGTGTQIDEKSIGIYMKLPISSDEASARRPPAAITVAAETKGSVDDSFSIPSMVRSHDPKVLGIRVSHSAESRKSHELLNGPDEMVAILNLINESYTDDKFWDKKRQGGMNNPIIAMIHNTLVRIRRFHRMLEDTQMQQFAQPVLDAMLRMYQFCTTVMTRSGRSALYNQAVKHVGEFYCYKFVTPPILAVANIPKRGAPGSANAILRDGIAALFALLIKGELNDASRAALRESLRSAGCSWAPPLMLSEVALDAMTENLKNRDVFAMRTREMGLTFVYMVFARHAYSAVKKFFDSPDRATGMPSKLHTLCACMGMARAEASKSALNKALTGEIGALLLSHAGDQRFKDALESADIDKAAAADILKASASGTTLDMGSLKAPALAASGKSPRAKSPTPRAS